MRRGFPLLLAVLIATPRSAAAAVTLWTEVVVRVYDATGARARDRQPALEVAAAIVSATSIGLVWMMCEADAPPMTEGPHARGESCASPMRAGELAVRIVRAPAGTRPDAMLPLGNALIDQQAGAGVLATVYADRVESMAAESGVDERVLLGRAIAHELGHLLLASRVHAREGLMRAIWSRVELRRSRTSDWAFRPEEIAAISARGLAR